MERITLVTKKYTKSEIKLRNSELALSDRFSQKRQSAGVSGRIYLIGLPGAGKTTLGEKLAKRLGRPFLDLDHVLQSRVEMTIPEFFSRYGEPYFRDQESLLLDAITKSSDNAVIATGGGIILRPENRQRLRESGVVVYLDRSPAAILEDMDVENRPMMRKNPMRLWELNEQRAPIYTECCHVRVCLQGSPNDSLKQLEGVLGLKRSIA